MGVAVRRNSRGHLSDVSLVGANPDAPRLGGAGSRKASTRPTDVDATTFESRPARCRCKLKMSP